MDEKQVIELHELRGLKYKGDFLGNLSKEDFDAGMIKFNIQDEDMTEGVWGWISPEDKDKYSNDKFVGDITVILCNDPLNFYGLLFWGTELEITCNGDSRPVLSEKWMKENVFSKDWYNS